MKRNKKKKLKTKKKKKRRNIERNDNHKIEKAST